MRFKYSYNDDIQNKLKKSFVMSFFLFTIDEKLINE